MLDDLDFEIPDRILAFPEADIRFSALASYVGGITESISFIHEQKCQRLRAEINSEKNIEEKFELEVELDDLINNGTDYISHTIWGGILMSVFFTFENSILQIFDYCHSELLIPKFKTKNKLGFVRCANNYSTEHLEISLFVSSLEREAIYDLAKLRNSYVHNGCKTDTPAKLKKLGDALNASKYGRNSPKIINDTWYANENNTKLHLHYAHKCFYSYQDRTLSLIYEKLL